MKQSATQSQAFDIERTLREHAQQVQEAFADEVASRLGEGTRLTLNDFYFSVFLPEQGRWRRLEIRSDTLGKEKLAINRWLQYSRPDNWPEDQEWPGLPLSLMTGAYIQSVLLKMMEELADGTAKSTWNHLHTLLGFAAKMGFLATAPSIDGSVFNVKPEQTLTDREIEEIYLALKDDYELQVAWLLTLTTGLRPLDLFQVEWELAEIYGDRPKLDLRPRCSDTPASVPLPQMIVRHLINLARIQGQQEFVFPCWSSAHNADPEKTTRSRWRREIIQRALRSIGIDAPKPFQAARATYKHRLQRFRKSIAKDVLASKPSATKWDNLVPSDLTYAVLNAIPWPAAFFELPANSARSQRCRKKHDGTN